MRRIQRVQQPRKDFEKTKKLREITDNYINEFKFSGEGCLVNRGIPGLIVQELGNNILYQKQREKVKYFTFGGSSLSLSVYIPIGVRIFSTAKTRRMAFSIAYKYNDAFLH